MAKFDEPGPSVVTDIDERSARVRHGSVAMQGIPTGEPNARKTKVSAMLTVICTLAIILIGIAILLQIPSLEEVLGFIGRAVAALVLMILALCILKGSLGWRDGCPPPSNF